MKSRMAKQEGFTIVELLIVIVVIAILAAITVVAYNGIQARAKLTQQVAQLDRIGKAIQLWSADTGETLYDSGAGYQGHGYGGFQGKAPATNYANTSVEELLRASGYLSGTLDTNVFNPNGVLLSPCTTGTDSRMAVMVTVSPAPQESIADQVADTGCTYGLVSLYTDPSGSYKRNLIRVY